MTGILPAQGMRSLRRDIMRSKSNRVVAAATAVALALTTAGAAPAFAAPRATKDVQVAQAAGNTEFSSRRYSRARSNAAAAAIFGAIIAGVATYAAAREYRKAREREYQYRYGYGAPYGYYQVPQPHPYRRHWNGW
jgi:hypothetical protein